MHLDVHGISLGANSTAGFAFLNGTQIDPPFCHP